MAPRPKPFYQGLGTWCSVTRGAIVCLADSAPAHLPGQARPQWPTGSPSIQAVQIRESPQQGQHLHLTSWQGLLGTSRLDTDQKHRVTALEPEFIPRSICGGLGAGGWGLGTCLPTATTKLQGSFMDSVSQWDWHLLGRRPLFLSLRSTRSH